MAFTKRIWLPHDVQYPGRKILIPTGNPNEYDLNRSEGVISAAGDLLSAENLNELEARIFNQFGIVPEISSGTWTPTLQGATVLGSPIYDTQIGIYIKINNMIFITIHGIAISSKGGMTGNVRIGGIPFIPNSRGFLGFASTSGVPAGLVGQFVNGSSLIYLLIGTTTDVVSTDLTDGTMLWGASGFYSI